MHDLGLTIRVGLAVVADLIDEPELHGLVLVSGIRTPTEELSEADVAAPLRAAVVDDMKVGNPMTRSSFEDENVTTVVARVAAVDPTLGLEPAPDMGEVVVLQESDGKIDDRLGEQPDDR